MATVVGRGVFTVNGWTADVVAVYQRGAGRVIFHWEALFWTIGAIAGFWFVGIPLLAAYITFMHIFGDTDDD